MTAQISRIGRRAHRLLCQTRRQENVIVCTDRALRHLPDDAVTWIIINASKEQISRVIVDAAVALVKAEKGRAAIAVVNHNGNLISMDSMDGNSRFWSRFAVGKAVGAVNAPGRHRRVGGTSQDKSHALQSAWRMLQGEILLIPGGTPLIIDNVVVGGVGSAGHRGDGDVRAVKADSPPGKNFARVGASCYQRSVLGSPLYGPTISLVTQPP